MTKIRQAKKKISRSLGCNLWGDPKSPYNKRPYPPGKSGPVKRGASDYAKQLIGKQKLKGYYGNIGEKQFKRYYQEASRRKGDTGKNLLELLERRLDAVVYRMKLAKTVFGAKQLIGHGHVLVNGKRVNIPSYSIQDGDEISVKDKAKNIPMVIDAALSADREIPDYVTVESEKFKGTFNRGPEPDEIPYPVQMEPNLVIEYYSR